MDWVLNPGRVYLCFRISTWFFMSCVVGAILFTILAIVIVTKYFKDMPLGTLTKEEADRIKEMM